jgi:hypothetical protein
MSALTGFSRGQLRPELAAHHVHGLPEDDRVRTGEIDVLEGAEGVPGPLQLLRLIGLDAVVIDEDDLAGLHFPDHLRADEVEGAGLRGQTPGAVELPDDQRTETVRVADADEALFVHHHQRVRPPYPVERVDQALQQVRRFRLGHEVDDDLRIRGGLEYRTRVLQLLPQLQRIDEIAVVRHAERPFGVIDEERLRVLQDARAGGRIAHVADRGGTLELREDVLAEHVADQPHMLVDAEPARVVGADAARLLAAMLLRVESEVGQPACLAVSVYPEEAAEFLRPVIDQKPF